MSESSPRDFDADCHGLALFDFLLSNTPDQVYFKDRDGRFLRISQAVAEYLGARDASEVIGKTDFDFWDAPTASAAAKDEQRVMETGEALVGKIERLAYPNGRVKWDYTTKLPLRNSAGEVIGICGINKDFTKVKEMEDALQAERDRLRVVTADLEAKNAQIEADLQMAKEVQEALLPREFKALSRRGELTGNTLSFAHCYLPAAAVGGDFFHILPLPENRAGIFICDVMGHGIRAALITAIIRALLEELHSLLLTPGPLMNALNQRVRTILERVDEPFIATAFYAVADPNAGQIHFANAGHPVPVRIRSGEGVVGLLKQQGERSGPGLGLFDDADYKTCKCALERDDRVVLYTDGAFEVDSPAGELFGREALLEEFAKHASLPSQDLFAAVLDDVRDFASRPDFDDDVCLVACECVAGARDE